MRVSALIISLLCVVGLYTVLGAQVAIQRTYSQLFLSAVVFANLGTPTNGTFVYCSDCTIANPCASGGTGAFAKRLNGAWVCN